HGGDAATLQVEHVGDLFQNTSVHFHADGVDAHVGASALGEHADARYGVLFAGIDHCRSSRALCHLESVRQHVDGDDLVRTQLLRHFQGHEPYRSTTKDRNALTALQI